MLQFHCAYFYTMFQAYLVKKRPDLITNFTLLRCIYTSGFQDIF